MVRMVWALEEKHTVYCWDEEQETYGHMEKCRQKRENAEISMGDGLPLLLFTELESSPLSGEAIVCNSAVGHDSLLSEKLVVFPTS